MNNIILTGRITKDPEIKHSTSANAYCRFTLAVDDGKDKDGNKQTIFVDCITYDKKAEFLDKYIKKGYMLGVIGSLSITEREDENGNRTRFTTVRAFNVENLQPKATAPAQQQTGATIEPNTGEPVNELPFEI